MTSGRRAPARWPRRGGRASLPGSGRACPCPFGPDGPLSWSTTNSEPQGAIYRGLRRTRDQALVRSRHRAGDAAPSTHSRPATPHQLATVRIGRRGRDRRAEGVGIVGRHGHPGARFGEQPRDRRAGIDGGDDRAAGGEDRVGLGRHARAGEAGPQRHHVHVAVASSSDQAVVGHVPAEADVGQPGGGDGELRSRRAPSPLTTNVAPGSGGPPRPSGRAIARTRRCRRTAPPARRRCPARRGRGHPVDRWYAPVSTKLGMVCTDPDRPRRSLARTFAARSSERTVTASGAAVRPPLEPRRRRR